MLKNGTKLTREVKLIQTRPVSITSVIAGGHPWVVIDNPGRRHFSGEAMWGDRHQELMSHFDGNGATRQIIPIGEDRRIPEGAAIKINLTKPSVFAPKHTSWIAAEITPKSLGPFATSAGVKLDPSRFELTEDGDPKVMAEFSANVVGVQGGPVAGAEGLRINYRFQPGWKFIELHARGDLVQPIGDRNTSLNMFVKGDGSGDFLRMRFLDASGQAFQPDYGRIDWFGWKFISFKLDGSASGHWGGANDGVVHYPTRLETLMLVDSSGNSSSPKSVSVAGITLISRKKA